MPVVSLEEVQQWLSESKARITVLDQELTQSAEDYVFSRLRTIYDVLTWTDTNTTPGLVRSIISMFIAAWEFDRTYSGSAGDDDSLARVLEGRATMLLQQLADGIVLIEDEPVEDGSPSFFPTDAATDLYENEGPVAGSAARHFSMGQVF